MAANAYVGKAWAILLAIFALSKWPPLCLLVALLSPIVFSDRLKMPATFRPKAYAYGNLLVLRTLFLTKAIAIYKIRCKPEALSRTLRLLAGKKVNAKVISHLGSAAEKSAKKLDGCFLLLWEECFSLGKVEGIAETLRCEITTKEKYVRSVMTSLDANAQMLPVRPEKFLKWYEEVMP